MQKLTANMVTATYQSYNPLEATGANALKKHRNNTALEEKFIYTYNSNNKLLTEAVNVDERVKTYDYDANGNNISVNQTLRNGQGTTFTMDYDALDRQAAWSDGTNSMRQVYQGAGWKRLGQYENDKLTKYVYDGDNVFADLNKNGKVLKNYVTPSLDRNLMVIKHKNGKKKFSYFSHDGIGSVRTVSDNDGLVKNKYDYTAFGEVWRVGTTEKLANRYTFTGREKSKFKDAPMFFRNRMYDPSTGRFDRRDPAGDDHAYGYAKNNPVNGNDPTGLYTEEAIYYVEIYGGEAVRGLRGWQERKRRGASYFTNKLSRSIEFWKIKDGILHFHNGSIYIPAYGRDGKKIRMVDATEEALKKMDIAKANALHAKRRMPWETRPPRRGNFIDAKGNTFSTMEEAIAASSSGHGATGDGGGDKSKRFMTYILDLNEVNCLGYATRRGSALQPNYSNSLIEVMKELGYICTIGKSARECHKHCNCSDYAMVYIHISNKKR